MALARCAVLSLSVGLALAARLGDDPTKLDLNDGDGPWPPSTGYKEHRKKTLKVNGSKYCNKCVMTSEVQDSCNYDSKTGGCKGPQKCYYPTGDSKMDAFGAKGYGYEFNDMQKRGFGFDAMGCLNQATARSRFDGQPLSLEDDFDQGCIKSFYTPSIENAWGNDDGGDLKVLTDNTATDWQLKEMREACLRVSDKFSYGKKDIVLIVANTPRKKELEAWLEAKDKDAGKLTRALNSYYISGTASTLKKFQKNFPLLVKNFVPEVYGLHTESGPKGGDIQGGALMATGKVAALIFFQSYKTECHRCDIQSMVQLCLALEKRGEMMCAFDTEKADKVLDQLKKKCPKVEKDGKFQCRNVTESQRLWGAVHPDERLDERHSLDDELDGKGKDGEDDKPVQAGKDGKQPTGRWQALKPSEEEKKPQDPNVKSVYHGEDEDGKEKEDIKKGIATEPIDKSLCETRRNRVFSPDREVDETTMSCWKDPFRGSKMCKCASKKDCYVGQENRPAPKDRKRCFKPVE